jgi:hypothetical protein
MNKNLISFSMTILVILSMIGCQVDTDKSGKRNVIVNKAFGSTAAPTKSSRTAASTKSARTVSIFNAERGNDTFEIVRDINKANNITKMTTTSSNHSIYTFEYDENNRMVCMKNYDNIDGDSEGDTLNATLKFSYSPNTMTVDYIVGTNPDAIPTSSIVYTYDVNDSTKVISKEVDGTNYTYVYSEDGTLDKIIDTNGLTYLDYTYDGSEVSCFSSSSGINFKNRYNADGNIEYAYCNAGPSTVYYTYEVTEVETLPENFLPFNNYLVLIDVTYGSFDGFNGFEYK